MQDREKAVVCECPADLVLLILDFLPGNVEMAACMKCGRTDLSEAIVTEPHPHDVQFHGYMRHDLSDEVRAWASAWPRFQRSDPGRVYLAATARFESKAELDAAIARATEQQKGVPLRDTLLALGIPSSEPPASLPKPLSGFIEMWNGLQLNDETPVDELLDAATRFNGPHRLAKDILARRPDLHDLAMILLWDPQAPRRDNGRFLVGEFHLTQPDLLDPIRTYLGWLNDNSTGEMNDICDLLGKMGALALPALPDLEAAAIRTQDTDYYANKDLNRLIAELKSLQK